MRRQRGSSLFDSNKAARTAALSVVRVAMTRAGCEEPATRHPCFIGTQICHHKRSRGTEMNKKILITGATGALGSEVVRQLAAKGENVRAAVRNPVKAREIDLGGTPLVHWDYHQRDSFEPALENVDRLLLIAPSGSTIADQELNPAIDTAKISGVKHTVLVTAMGVEYNDQAPMRKVEKHLLASGLTYTILRPNWFMQNFASWMASTIKDGGIYLPAGTAQTSFIDVRDIASVIVKVFSDHIHHNKEYTLTGSEPLSHADVAQKISTAAGKPIAYIDLEEGKFKAALTAAGFPLESANFMANLYSFVRAGYSAPVTDSVGKILGRAPVTFDTFASDYADRWK